MCFSSYRNQILCFWLRSEEVFWRARIFFEKEHLSKFFMVKTKKHWSSCHKNYYIDCAFVYRKNRKLRPNLLLTLRVSFSKIRARYQRYPLDPLVNAHGFGWRNLSVNKVTTNKNLKGHRLAHRQIKEKQDSFLLV